MLIAEHEGNDRPPFRPHGFPNQPQVRFVGSGTILPDAKQMTVAFEAVSARSVQVTATREGFEVEEYEHD